MRREQQVHGKNIEAWGNFDLKKEMKKWISEKKKRHNEGIQDSEY